MNVNVGIAILRDLWKLAHGEVHLMLFRYAQIERAIARAHDLPLDDDSMKTFRSRVRNLQKLGLVPTAPGKGRSISYTTKDAIFWALCFEFSELGLSPSIMKEVMDAKGKEMVFVATTYFDDENRDKDKYILLRGEFLRWHLSGETQRELAGKKALRIHTLDRFLKDGLPVRCALINLSALVRKLSNTLAAEVTIEDTSSVEPGTITTARGF